MTPIAAVQGLWEPEPGWLNTASYGLPPRPGFEALTTALADWRRGRVPWETWDLATGRARAAFARLVGVSTADVTVGSTVSQLVAPVAAALRPGSRVLVPDQEFTSVVYPWLSTPGVEVTAVPVEQLIDAIDERTDLVAASLVQSVDGTVLPLRQLSEAARTAGALLVIDASQACGWLPFDAGLADFVAVAAYKWLMSPRGSAFAYVAEHLRERLVPSAAGWYAGQDVMNSFYGPKMRLAEDARRLDISPAWFSYVGAAPTLELIEQIGVDAIHDHDLTMANRFRAGLGLSPGDSAIVAVDVPGAQERLAAAGVRAAARGGRVRAAFHVYTTADEVDMAVEALTAG